MPTPMPESQRQLTRNAARRARRNATGDVALAKQLLGQYLAREIGAAWLSDGQRLGEALIDHWGAEGIVSPTVQAIEGEPR
jgi:hypothetical protein